MLLLFSLNLLIVSIILFASVFIFDNLSWLEDFFLRLECIIKLPEKGDNNK